MEGIGFGTWAWGNQLLWGYNPNKDDKILEATFHEAISGGLNFIDTADSYGTGLLNGRSELLLGKFLQALPPNKRKKLIVATKLAPFPWRIGENGFKRAFFASQKRLNGQINHIQLHWSTYRYAPWQEGPLLDGLGNLVEANYVESLGVSNVGPKRLKWMHKRLTERGINLKSLQIQFSLLAPNYPHKSSLKDICDELGIELIGYSPLALGILSLPPESDKQPATFLRRRIFQRIIPKSKKLRKSLKEIAKRYRVSQTQVALNWCRAHGVFPIPGLRNPQHAREASNSLKWKLNMEERKKLDLLSEECEVRMPNNPFQST